MDDLVADRLQIPLSLISLFLSVPVYRHVEGSDELCACCWVALPETLRLWLIFQAEKDWQLLLWLDKLLYINRVDCQAEVPHASNPSGICNNPSVRGSHTRLLGFVKKTLLSVLWEHGPVHCAQLSGSWPHEQRMSCPMGSWCPKHLAHSAQWWELWGSQALCLVSLGPEGGLAQCPPLNGVPRHYSIASLVLAVCFTWKGFKEVAVHGASHAR